MALIRYAEGQQRSGSLGSTVYSHNRFGQYLRPRTVPVNPSTALQVAVRNAMAATAIAWNTILTPAQRTAWNSYAAAVSWLNKLGEVVQLTGLNHYIRTNTARDQAGLARLDDAPTLYNVGDPEQSLEAAASEATQILAFSYDDGAAWCDEDDAVQLVYMGTPQNASRGFFKGPYRYLGQIDGDSAAPPSSPASLIDPPFVVVEGQRIWVRTRILRADGRLSAFAEVNFLAAS